MIDEQRITKRIRRMWFLPKDISDEKILARTKGSLFRARVELTIAVEDFRKELLGTLNPVGRLAYRGIERFVHSFKRIKP